ncbi:hypothetical protein [Streptomyces sp. NPDC017941]
MTARHRTAPHGGCPHAAPRPRVASPTGEFLDALLDALPEAAGRCD